MKQRTVNLICVLLAVAGVGFGAGSVANGGAQQTKVTKVKDTATQRWLIEIATNQINAEDQLHAICQNVRLLVEPSPYRGSPPSCDIGRYAP